MSEIETDSGIQGIEAELMLLNWNESATGGAKLIFAISPEDLEPFKLLTRKEGKRPGQRLQAVFVPIAEDETPKPRRPVGPRCMLAGRWCKEPLFHEFLSSTWPTLWAECANTVDGGEFIPRDEAAAGVLRRLCGIGTRFELDERQEAARSFDLLIRGPYSEIRK